MNTDKKGNNAVFGLFKTRGSLESAVDALKASGFRNSDISALLPNKEGSEDFAHQKATKAPEGTATGVATGAAVGGGLGWLVGIGALAIPGIGPFVAAGPIMAALAGAGIGGTVGGLTGALIGMGIPEYEGKRYETYVKEGGMLLSVHVDDRDWAKKAKDILEEYGAEDIDTEGEEKAARDNRFSSKTTSTSSTQYRR
jgi:hypothetical protein